MIRAAILSLAFVAVPAVPAVAQAQGAATTTSTKPTGAKPATTNPTGAKPTATAGAKPTATAGAKPTATAGAKPTAAKPTAATKPAAQRSTDKTTLSGIYTTEEADAGKELYLALCASCHQAIAHTGPEFRKKWAGRPLSELFSYMRELMPKNDPGSLADEDYGVILAYMLQMNRMPPGKAYLSTDTTELRKIRIDTLRTAHKP